MARTSRLVSWPSVSNQRSARPLATGRNCDCGCRDDFDRGEIEGIDVLHAESFGRAGAQALPRASHRLHHDDPRLAKASLAEELCKTRRRRLVPGEAEDFRAGLQGWNDALELTPMQRDKAALLQAPFEPGRREAERGRGGHAVNFSRVNMGAEQAADAVKERVARGEDTDGRAAPRQNFRDRLGKRRGPGHGLCRERTRQREVTGAAHDQLGLRDECPRGRRKSLDTIFADADQREPFSARGRGHGGRGLSQSSGGGRCGFSCLAGRRRRASSRASLRGKAASLPYCPLPAAQRSREAPQIPYRIGGFGGVEGLAAYLETERIDVLIDATHPFAEQMSRHAVLAARRAKIPLVVLSRPAWRPDAADRWIKVEDMAAAAAALGQEPKRVFLTVGRLQIAAFAAAPQHFYLIRAIEPLVPPPGLPRHRVILGRGPFAIEAEEKLLREELIEMIVTKNSGGEATFAKLLAARALGLPVVMVARPPQAAHAVLHDPAKVMEFLLHHRESLVPREV